MGTSYGSTGADADVSFVTMSKHHYKNVANYKSFFPEAINRPGKTKTWDNRLLYLDWFSLSLWVPFGDRSDACCCESPCMPARTIMDLSANTKIHLGVESNHHLLINFVCTNDLNQDSINTAIMTFISNTLDFL